VHFSPRYRDATMAESLTGLDMVIRWIEGFHLMAESVEDCGWIKGWDR